MKWWLKFLAAGVVAQIVGCILFGFDHIPRLIAIDIVMIGFVILMRLGRKPKK